ncbi:uncharacterized protein LOC141640850 [Silene latifolia]|uniref:uncharacterized protein LOC141640850 n=1 Tax=Silene latifolia TaxID=37657 RepID=UPI003D78A5C0
MLIEDRNGHMCDTPEQVHNAFLEYYQSLLGAKQETKRVHRKIIEQGPRCNVDHHSLLNRQVIGKEVRNILFGIPDIKSPGPDGYTSKFFKDAWGVIGGDVITAVQDFFTHKKLLRKINATTLTLVPKLYNYFKLLFISNGDIFGYSQADKFEFNYHPLCKEVKLENLMFADDVLLFSRGDACSMMLLLRSFSTFSEASGLQTTRLKKTDCECLVEKICSRIHNYGAKKFSYTGRLVLVKSVHSTLHSYWASMFVLPKGIISKIEATCRNFLWDNSPDYRRIPLVTWDKLSCSKEEGGLGLKDQETMNKAMIGRLVHWIMEEKDLIWVQWVNKNYL